MTRVPAQQDSLATLGPAEKARALLAAHPQFGGRAANFQFVVEDGVLVVRGTVPSFYLKQILQNTLKDLPGVRRIENRVVVVSQPKRH